MLSAATTMSRARIREAGALQRKQRVPDSDRTAARDEVADWIEAHAADDWVDWTMTAVAEEVGYSREHVAKTLEAYFEPAGGERSELAELLGGEAPTEQSSEYRAGFSEGFATALNLPDEVLRRFVDDD
jgi:hypothetical protein